MAKTDGPWKKDEWTLVAERGSLGAGNLETEGRHFKTESEARERLESSRAEFHFMELVDPTGETVELIGKSVFG